LDLVKAQMRKTLLHPDCGRTNTKSLIVGVVMKGFDGIKYSVSGDLEKGPYNKGPPTVDEDPTVHKHVRAQRNVDLFRAISYSAKNSRRQDARSLELPLSCEPLLLAGERRGVVIRPDHHPHTVAETPVWWPDEYTDDVDGK
jgi:hypothetical protein